ncbi:hypothetical protein MBANPS3_010027, partial [Mucor bainieri]
ATMDPSEDLTSITRVSTPYELSPLSFDAPYEFPRHFLPTVMKGDCEELAMFAEI